MDAQQLLSNYFDWMSEKYVVNSFETGDEIITPFQNSIGDNIAIYIIDHGDGRITLTDDGTTLNDLTLMGINVSLNSRKQIIDYVAKSVGVVLLGNELSVSGSSSEFPAMKQSLLQAILHIDDLTYTKKGTTKNIFFEEVRQYLNDKKFGGLPDYHVDGASGIDYTIAYAIGRSDTKPARFIQILNNANFQNIAQESIAVDDIRKTGNYSDNDLSYNVLINDQVNSLNDKSIKLAQEYRVNLIGWNEKSKIMSLKN